MRLNDTTRIFLAAYAQQTGRVKGDLNRVLRTTCVAKLLDGGHAGNALPQRAGANLNIRLTMPTPPNSL